ncbi:MAG TPA: GAF domain-containing protein [Solirubrobacteraceae bacterium]
MEIDGETGLVDALFGSAPVGLAFFDEELRYVRVNDTLAAMSGVPAEAHAGRTACDVLAPMMGQRLAGVLADTLRTGRPRRDVELSGRLPGDPATRHWLASTYVVAGGAARVGLVVTDVTSRHRVEKERRRLLLIAREARERAEQAERRSAFLAAAGTVLARSLDFQETLDAIAGLAVPAIADWCFVELVQDDGGIKRVASAAADPAHAARIPEIDARYPLDPGAPFGSPQVIRTGEPLLVEHIPDEQLDAIAQDAEHAALMRSLDFCAVIIVPLRARGRILGDIAMTAGSARGFDGEDLEMAQELADRCALAVDNARLYAERGPSGGRPGLAG